MDQPNCENPSILLFPCNEDVFLFRSMSIDGCKTKMTMNNPYPDSIAFRVMTNQPNKFAISPIVGIIGPLSSQDINIYYYPKNAEPGGSNKFCIQFMRLNNIEIRPEEINSLFNGKYMTHLKESRVTCFFDDEARNDCCKAAIETSNAVRRVRAGVDAFTEENMRGDRDGDKDGDKRAKSIQSSASNIGSLTSAENMREIKTNRKKRENLMLQLNYYNWIIQCLIVALFILCVILALLLYKVWLYRKKRYIVAYKNIWKS